MALINKKELKENFLLENQYGIKGSNDTYWPRNTILLYNLRSYDFPSSAIPSKPQTTCDCRAGEGHIWDRLDNDPRIDTGTIEIAALHAEVKLVKKVMADLIEMDPKPRKIELRIVASYSPCTNCANVLTDFKHYVEIGMDILCTIKIKFSSFYNCYMLEHNFNSLPGLCELLKNAIALETFNGAVDWNWFLTTVLGMSIDIESLTGFSRGRIEREAVDDEILHAIKLHMSTSGQTDLVPLKIGNSATYKDAHTAGNEMKQHMIGLANEAAGRLKVLDVDVSSIESKDPHACGDQHKTVHIPSLLGPIDTRDLACGKQGGARNNIVQSSQREQDNMGIRHSFGKANTSFQGGARGRGHWDDQRQGFKRQHGYEEQGYVNDSQQHFAESGSNYGYGHHDWKQQEQQPYGRGSRQNWQGY